ncbi:substrate-binding periplasmic protein [Roseateles sp. LYH14W]|uniref:Substrate-binding periplasmic protein n=1 Tax=Pelomonas parva TaxID=3299032 RepID=A0ABW7FAF2_9BURK
MRPTAFLALLLSSAAPAQALDMLVYPNAGIFDIDDGGRIAGPGAAMLDRLRNLSGTQLEPKVIPFARALLAESLQPGTCLIALTRTPEREARYRWAGPWSSSVIALYGRTGETRQVKGPEDMRGARIAALRAAPTATWLQERGLDAYEVNDVAAGLRLLQAGRVDYWLGNDMVTRLALKASGAAMPRVLYSFGRIDLYVACHIATPAAIVDRLNAGLTQLRVNGELAEFGLGR